MPSPRDSHHTLIDSARVYRFIADPLYAEEGCTPEQLAATVLSDCERDYVDEVIACLVAYGLIQWRSRRLFVADYRSESRSEADGQDGSPTQSAHAICPRCQGLGTEPPPEQPTDGRAFVIWDYPSCSLCFGSGTEPPPATSRRPRTSNIHGVSATNVTWPWHCFCDAATGEVWVENPFSDQKRRGQLVEGRFIDDDPDI